MPTQTWIAGDFGVHRPGRLKDEAALVGVAYVRDDNRDVGSLHWKMLFGIELGVHPPAMAMLKSAQIVVSGLAQHLPNFSVRRFPTRQTPLISSDRAVVRHWWHHHRLSLQSPDPLKRHERRASLYHESPSQIPSLLPLPLLPPRAGML